MPSGGTHIPGRKVLDTIDRFLARGEEVLAEAARLDDQVSDALPSGAASLRSLWEECRAAVLSLRDYASRAERLAGAPQARRDQELRQSALAAQMISTLLLETWRSELGRLGQEIEAILSNIAALVASAS